MHTVRRLIVVALATPVAAAAQWTQAASGTTAELRGLSAVTDRVAWASGTRGTVVRSVDGGRTWVADTIAGQTHLDFRSIHAWSGGAALIASAGEAEKGLARMLATTDTGRRWKVVFDTSQKGVFLDALAFWDSKHGIALSDPVDGRFFVLLTTDGGGSWRRIPPERLPPNLPGEAAFAASGSSVAVVGDSMIWIGTGGGGRARVMRSADRGQTWSVTDVPLHADGPAAGIFALAFFDRDHGIAVGGDYTKPFLAAHSVALTRDGGRTWRSAIASPSAYLSGVSYAGDRQRVVAVGLAGTFVSRDGGESWAHRDTTPLNSVRFRGDAGFGVGPRGRIVRMDSLRR